MTLLFLAILCLALVACGGSEEGTPETTEETTEETTVEKISYEPTIASVIEGIKNNFKDPDSVQVSDGCWAPVLVNGERSETEFYIICTVRAKNSFGGYADPQAYVIHSLNGNYSIVKEYNDYDFLQNKALQNLGCDSAQGLR